MQDIKKMGDETRDKKNGQMRRETKKNGETRWETRKNGETRRKYKYGWLVTEWKTR